MIRNVNTNLCTILHLEVIGFMTFSRFESEDDDSHSNVEDLPASVPSSYWEGKVPDGGCSWGTRQNQRIAKLDCAALAVASLA